MRFLVLSLLASLLLCTPAAAATFSIHVDAVADPSFDPAAVHAIAPTPEQQADLAFNEVLPMIERGLERAGLQLQQDPQQPADVLVSVSYGVSEPQQKTSTSRVPIEGVIGVEPAETRGRVDGLGNWSATTTVRTRTGIVGFQDVTETDTVFTRRLTLVATDARRLDATGRPKTLWKADIVSTGQSGDIRYVLPFLVQAGAAYYGKSSGQRVKVKLGERDKRVLYVRTGVEKK